VAAAAAQLQQQRVRLAQSAVHGARRRRDLGAAAATVGAVVGNGTELFRLIRKGRLEWRAEVTSANWAAHRGTTALVTAASGARLEGRVRMIGPTVDPQNRIAWSTSTCTRCPARRRQRPRRHVRARRIRPRRRAGADRCRSRPWSCARASATCSASIRTTA
jgi:hypothetical protein